MTTLPAVTVNSQAYELACAWFRTLRDYRDDTDPLPWLRTSPLTPQTGEEFVRHILQQGAMLNPVNRLHLIAAARNGSVDAQKVLGDIIIHCHGRGIQMPPDLITYDMEVHAGLIRPYSQPGPRRKDKLLRNQFIAMGVELLIDRFGLPATAREATPRGRPSSRRPASAIVADAYTVVVAPLSPKRVEAIHRERRGSMPTVPGWSQHWMPAVPG
jgi:hypothetical protein